MLSQYDALTDPACDFVRSPRFQQRLFKPLARAQPPGSVSGPLSMPNIEQGVLDAIDRREHHLSRLHALLQQSWQGSEHLEAQAGEIASLRAQLRDELDALRLAGVAVVEAVMRWRRRRRRRLEAFVWRSHNYLLKMLLDIFFLGLCGTVTEAVHDPLLLTCFEDAPNGLQATSEVLRRHRVILMQHFQPTRRHTQRELVRMWAAERTLEAERLEIGDAFAPASPALRASDVQLRQNAAFLFFGIGESAQLMRLASQSMLPSRTFVQQSLAQPLDMAWKQARPRRIPALDSPASRVAMPKLTSSGGSVALLASSSRNTLSLHRTRTTSSFCSIQSRFNDPPPSIASVKRMPIVPLVNPLDRARKAALGRNSYAMPAVSPLSKAVSAPNLPPAAKIAGERASAFFAPETQMQD